MKWLISRLSEPSTHAGIGVLVAVAAHFLPQYSGLIFTLAGAFGFGGFVLSEKTK